MVEIPTQSVTRICLVRHGETEWNAARRIQGQIDIGLNETGRRQAVAAGLWLKSASIAGAALDVYESEPAPPQELIDLDRLLLSPHVGGWSPEAIDAQFSIFLENLNCVFSGKDPVTAVY